VALSQTIGDHNQDVAGTDFGMTLAAACSRLADSLPRQEQIVPNR
jgi:hypothetical protein